MTETQEFEDLVKSRWDEANASGHILFRADTLSVRQVLHDGVPFHLLHNACRDVYDRSPKAVDRPVSPATPFSDGSNPELAQTPDGRFKVLGNRFACLRYQSILVPVETTEVLTEDFIAASLCFAPTTPS